MSHTEQMRDALQKYVAWCDAESNHAGTTFYERMDMCREAEEAARAALTAPAAEVPEAMGDAEISELCAGIYLSDHGNQSDYDRAIARAIIAARDAQWQSTRLRGGVPDRAAMSAQAGKGGAE